MFGVSEASRIFGVFDILDASWANVDSVFGLAALALASGCCTQGGWIYINADSRILLTLREWGVREPEDD